MKVLAVVALGLVVLYFWPAAMVPLALGALAILAAGCLLLVGVVVAGAVGVGLIAGLAAVTLALLGALSPVWVPLALLLGAIWMIKRLCGSRPPRPAV